jgi:hypothetical protein
LGLMSELGTADSTQRPPPQVSAVALVSFVSALATGLLIAIGFGEPDAWAFAIATWLVAIVCAPIGSHDIRTSAGTRYGKGLIVAAWIIAVLCILFCIGAFLNALFEMTRTITNEG